MMKTCPTCEQRKSTSKFGANKSAKGGLHPNCLLCEKIRDATRRHSSSRRFSRYKRRARRKEIKFEINIEDFTNITKKSCTYCGSYSNINDYCGIDRVNSNKGYVKSNMVPCCGTCNMMKGTLTYKEFTKQIKTIHNNLKKKK